MPWTKDTIIRKASADYLAGGRVVVLAERYKVPISTLTSWLRDAGVKFRPAGFDKRRKFDEKAMVASYLAGESVLALASHYGVARLVIDDRLRIHGVKKRTAAEQAFITSSNTSAEEKKRRVQAAHAAVRGSKHPHASLVNRANKRQIAGKMTAKEARWKAQLDQAGIMTVPQYAIDKYTVDLAIPDVRIALEIKSGWSYSPRKKAADERKRILLESRGWLVLSLTGSRWKKVWVERIWQYALPRRSLMLQ